MDAARSRVAIVGAGPAGAFAAASLLRARGDVEIDLFERLQSVPQTTPITPAPTVIGPDGSAMLSTMAPMAAFVAPKRPSRKGER